MHEPDIRLVELPYDNVQILEPKCSIGIVQDLAPNLILREAINSGIHQIVQKSNLNYHQEIKTSKIMLRSPEKFLLYPLSTILHPDKVDQESETGLSLFQFHFTRAAQKSEMLDSLSGALKKFANRTSQYDICLIADEMFSNACYNAPYNSPGAQTNNVPREDLSIRENSLKPGLLAVAREGDQCAIICRDEYGTLDPDALLHRLFECFEDGAQNSIKYGTGGAGLGSMMVFNACSGLYVGVERGVRTVVAATITVGNSENRTESKKTLHFFLK